MLKRLYIRIYLTIVLSLAVVVLVAVFIWDRSDDGAMRRRDLASELLASAIAAKDAPRAVQAESVQSLGGRLKTPLSLFDEELQPIGHFGTPLPPPVQGGHGWVPAPDGPAWALNLPDGRWMVVRVPFAPPRYPALGLLLALGGIAIVVAIAVFPVARGLTRRLERLQGGVESLGGGDLAARVKVEGRDEVARLAESFNRAAARIEALVGAHKALLANASHELRTPLARIRLALELSRDQLVPLRKREMEQDIAELDEMIDDILTASRLEAQTGLERTERVDLLAIAAEEGARFPDCTVGGTAGAVDGDPRLLRRLVRNLVDNAHRHGRPPVDVSVEARDGSVRLVVADAGSGVASDDRATLFERFGRGGGATHGTGLGLHLVRQIAERHGGVAAYAADGSGTRFTVRFPEAADGPA